jgi:uncharacterized DUF497 family protein
MPLRIEQLVWLEDMVEKLRWKHGVEDSEVVEVLENQPCLRLKEAGHVPGEDVYAAFGRTNSGRLLSVFFVYTRDRRAIIVSARDMTAKEVRRYG